MLDARAAALAQGAMGAGTLAVAVRADALFGETPGAAAEAAKAAKKREDEGAGSVSRTHQVVRVRGVVRADATSRGVGVTRDFIGMAKRALAFLDEPSVWPRSGDEWKRWGRWPVPVPDRLDWTVQDLRGVRVRRGDVQGDALRRRKPRLYDAKLQEDGSKFADRARCAPRSGAGGKTRGR